MAEYRSIDKSIKINSTPLTLFIKAKSKYEIVKVTLKKI